MGKIHFITATGTDAGKTFVAEGLARAWRAAGIAVRALKPLMSGYDEAQPQACDAGRLLAACGREATPQNIAAVSPWRFRAPLSPDRAAALEDRSIDFEDLVAWSRFEIVRSEDALLMEGIGGVMVPIDAHHTVRDWVAALDMPIMLVAGTYLGALSHTLTALAALREIGLRPACIVVNESADGVGLAETVASLASQVDGIHLFELARGDADGCARLATALLEMP